MDFHQILKTVYSAQRKERRKTAIRRQQMGKTTTTVYVLPPQRYKSSAGGHAHTRRGHKTRALSCNDNCLKLPHTTAHEIQHSLGNLSTRRNVAAARWGHDLYISMRGQLLMTDDDNGHAIYTNANENDDGMNAITKYWVFQRNFWNSNSKNNARNERLSDGWKENILELWFIFSL